VTTSTKESVGRILASKVPEVTLVFWITKILTTGMGESLSDFLAKQLGPLLALSLAALALAIALFAQFRLRRYVAGVYWVAVVMVSVFGTMAADGLHIVVGVPYAISATVFAVALAAILTAWYLTERTLSIHSITTTRREIFYWATVMATFALGTAVGDLTASTLHLGYLPSAIGFTLLFFVPAVAFWAFKMNAVVAFWFAYVVTRPLGASYADWLASSHAHGGLGLGTGPTSLILTTAIAIFVVVLSLRGRKSTFPSATKVDLRPLRQAEE
jgi:uncharacterized membrane-anchored protein